MSINNSLSVNSLRLRWHSVANKFWSIVGAVSIRTKILGMVLVLMLLVGIGITYQVRIAIMEDLEVHLKEDVVWLAQDLAARSTELILTNDTDALNQLLQNTVDINDDAQYALILDGGKNVVAATFEAEIPLGLVEANECLECKQHNIRILTSDAGRVWDIAMPISDTRSEIVRVGLSDNRIQRTLNAVTGQLFSTALVVSVLGVLGGGFLTWLITKPILALAEAARTVGRGDLSIQVVSWADDEVGDLTQAFNEMTSKLALAEKAQLERNLLRAQLKEKTIAAQEEERKRISRELHDETGQSISTIMVGLRTIMELSTQPEVKTQAADLRKVAAETLENVHQLALELRPSVLDDIGLVAALERYISDYRKRHSLAIDFAVVGLENWRLPAPVETAIYRIIQECLTNIIRHANASTVSVLLERRNDNVRAIVEDDGCGFKTEIMEQPPTRLGIYGIQERVELLGGETIIESYEGIGTIIAADIPIETIQADRATKTDRTPAKTRLERDLQDG